MVSVQTSLVRNWGGASAPPINLEKTNATNTKKECTHGIDS